VILSFNEPVEIFADKLEGHTRLPIADLSYKVIPLEQILKDFAWNFLSPPFC
jgi:hypothetical protein